MNKNILPIFFIISITLTVIGALFKIQHWEGSQILTISGLLSYIILLVLFIYKIAISKKEVRTEKLIMNRNILSIFFAISTILIITGAFFKIQHWEGSQILTISGLLSYVILLVLFLYKIAISKEVNGIEKLMWFIGFIFFFPIAAIIYISSARKN